MIKRLCTFLILSSIVTTISAKKLMVSNTSASGMSNEIHMALAGDDKSTIDTLVVVGTELYIEDCRHLRDSFLTNLVHLDLSGVSFENDFLPSSSNDGAPGTKGGAFQSMTALKSVILPIDLKVIGDRAFRVCSALEYVELPNSLQAINSRVFFDCGSLAIESLPEGIMTIGAYAFRNCEKLTFENLPTTITSFDANAFEGCTELVLTKLPESLNSMNTTNVFKDCKKIALSALPSGVVGKIANSYFDGFTLNGIQEIPEGVSEIGDFAFRNNYETKSIALPIGLTTLGKGVFASANKNLTEIYFKGNNPPSMDQSNLPFRFLDEISVYIPTGSRVIYNTANFNNHNFKEIIEYDAVFTGVGNWSDVENWSTGILPAANDTVLIDGDITIDDDQSIAGLIVKDGSSVTVANEKYLNVTHILTGNSQDVVTLNGSAQLFRPEDEFTGLEKLSNKNRKTNVSVTSERQIIVDVREVLDDSFSNKVSVFNIFGQLIHQENINTPRIFLNTWFDTGVYFVQIGKQNTHKVIIQ